MAEPDGQNVPTLFHKAFNVFLAPKKSGLGNLPVGLSRPVRGYRVGRDLAVLVLRILHAPVFHHIIITPHILVTSTLSKSGKSTLVD